MNLATFEATVRGVVDSIPAPLRDRLDNVTVEVAMRPTRDQDPAGEGLFGLYEGIPISERGMDYFGVAPDTIYVFYEPHAQLGLDERGLRDEVRTTVLHEIGHHLGITDERLTEIGWG